MKKIFYRNLRDKKLQTLEQFRVGSWIHIEEPIEQDLIELCDVFHLDKGLLADALDIYEVPRMEVEDGIVYIFTRYPFKKNDQVSTSPLLFVIAKEVFITITREKFFLLENFLERYEFYTTQKNKLLLHHFKLIDNAYNTYFHTISRQIRSSAYELEKITNKDIIQFVNYERVLNDFHLALVRMNAVLNSLTGHHIIRFYEEDKELIDDLFLSNDQLIQLSKENLRSIVNIRDAYTTIMTNNTNRVIRFFTSITVILTIPMIVTSMYGMNVGLPFAQSPWAFTGLMLFTLIITGALVLVFLINDWL